MSRFDSTNPDDWDEVNDMKDSFDDDPSPEELGSVCSFCNCASEGDTEIIEWIGEDKKYFCGTPCKDSWYEEFWKANCVIDEQ